tara:strand:+ start:18505 stop:19395 length:891 start_codon:yes stop_codon:yes gene_type:complete
MKAAIIGCNGYLGKHLCAFLLEKNWSILGYDKSEASSIPLTKYQSLDITQKDQLKNIDIQVDFVFYFSGITGTLNGYDKYETYLDINEKGLMNLLNQMKQSKSSARLIFPSTRLIYKGQKDQLLDEDAEKESKTIYALTKWFGEQAIQQYSNYFNISYNIFRICIPYGNTLSKEYSYGTMGLFLHKAMANEKITLYGDGDQKRTFTHVEDICLQIYNAVLIPQTKNRIFNIAGETFSLAQIANQIAAKYNTQVEYVEWPELDKKLESGDTIFDGKQILAVTKKPLKNSFYHWLLNL